MPISSDRPPSARQRRLRRRLTAGLAIPTVLLFVGLLISLQIPSHLFVLTSAFERLGLLGARARPAGLVPRPTPGPGAPILLMGGTLWDAVAGRRPNPGLPMEAGRIAARAAEGAATLDAAGLFLMPGFTDMHVHAFGGSFDGEMMLASGITAARDVGSPLDEILARRKAAEAGTVLSPRLFVTGPYLVETLGASDQEIGAASPEEAVAVVERFARQGADGIKLAHGIDLETMRAAVAAAHARGLWVAAHLDGVGMAEAAALGVDTIEHVSGLGRRVVADEAALEALLASSAALVPTLIVAEHAFTIRGLAGPDNPLLAYVPWLARRFWVGSQLTNAEAGALSREEEVVSRRQQLDRLKRFVGRYHARGGRVLVGSDAPAFLVAHGFDYPRELELLVEAGLSPEEALAAATLHAARALRREKEMGTLAPGMRADLVGLAADPLASSEGISATRRVALVIKDGRIVLDHRAAQ